MTLCESRGCDICGGPGHKGRVGLHEMLVGTDAIQRGIQEHKTVSALFTTAIDEGMRTLKQDSIEKVLKGITDMRQVRQVCIK